ncbi:MAG: hypothetical protein QW215_05295 [Ignisphaera sp.]
MEFQWFGGGLSCLWWILRQTLSFRCESMLFDPKLKRRRENLYNFDEELAMSRRFFREPLTVVIELRGTGKTSLILTALEEATTTPYLFIDLRSVVRPWREFYELLSYCLTDFLLRISRVGDFYEYLQRILSVIKDVSVSGFSVEFSLDRDRPTPTQIFTAIDNVAEEYGIKVLIVFNEDSEGYWGYRFCYSEQHCLCL